MGDCKDNDAVGKYLISHGKREAGEEKPADLPLPRCPWPHRPCARSLADGFEGAVNLRQEIHIQAGLTRCVPVSCSRHVGCSASVQKNLHRVLPDRQR